MKQPDDPGWKSIVQSTRDIPEHASRRRWLACVGVDEDGCWIWHGPVYHSTGYGYFDVSDRSRSPFSWFLILWGMADVYEGLKKGHRFRLCGKKLCVRPSCATRHRKGSGRNFDWDEAKRMRAEGMSYQSIAVKLGVSRRRVNVVCKDVEVEPLRKTFNQQDVFPLFAEGMSIEDVVRLTGMSRRIAYRYRQEYMSGRAPVSPKTIQTIRTIRALRTNGFTDRYISNRLGINCETIVKLCGPGPRRKAKRAETNMEMSYAIWTMRQEGRTLAEVAEYFGLSLDAARYSGNRYAKYLRERDL